MTLDILDKQTDLDNFIISKTRDSFRSGLFLQSWFWGEILKREGKKITRLADYDKQCLVATVTLIKNKIFLGVYYYSPGGPLIKKINSSKTPDFLSDFILEITKFCRQEKIIFWRFEPGLEFLDKIEQTIVRPGQLVKIENIQPAKTTWLDLNLKPEELLAKMHPKTRYNIRLASKKGVVVREGGANDLDIFWNLMKETAGRDAFRLHGFEHYKNLLSNSQEIKLFLAEFEGRVIAVGLFSFFAGTVTYLHGASSNSERNLMAPYLLQWEVIVRAKTEGYKRYDFYGIDEQKWPGVTRFKLGFGGEITDSPGTFDLVFRPGVYRFYKIMKNIRKVFRF